MACNLGGNGGVFFIVSVAGKECLGVKMGFLEGVHSIEQCSCIIDDSTLLRQVLLIACRTV